jgi:hypothetical protein
MGEDWFFMAERCRSRFILGELDSKSGTSKAGHSL